MIYQPGDNRWLDVVKSFERTAYRLEQQPIYLDDVRAGLLDDWLAGATEPPPPNDWSQFVAGKIADGAEVVRVRVIEDPPTPYQQWLKWYSAKNIAAGEQHFYVARQFSRESKMDFWLLDDTTVVWFNFDDEGNQTVTTSSEPSHLDIARAAWRMALNAAAKTAVLQV